MTSIYTDDASNWPQRYPGPKNSASGFAATDGTSDQVLVAVSSPLTMMVVEGIDVLATSSGTGTEFFEIQLWDGGGAHFVGTLFGNQVSPPTGLNFTWRGRLSVYSNQVVKLHSVSGPWSASFFGFLTSADNLPR